MANLNANSSEIKQKKGGSHCFSIRRPLQNPLVHMLRLGSLSNIREIIRVDDSSRESNTIAILSINIFISGQNKGRHRIFLNDLSTLFVGSNTFSLWPFEMPESPSPIFRG
jgi:hypothetical protein